MAASQSSYPIFVVQGCKVLTAPGENLVPDLFERNSLPDPSLRVAGFQLDDAVVEALEEILPAMAERTVTAITLEVPSYADAFSGRMGQNIENAVQTSLGAFLRLVTRAHGSDPGPPLSPALDGAYELGRGEARQGRSIDALLSAYRVGARVAWRQMSTTVVEAGLPAPTVAKFAELVFAYIDELSAASASGHTDELATTGRVRQRYLDRLTLDLLAASLPRLCSPAPTRQVGSRPKPSRRCWSRRLRHGAWPHASANRRCNCPRTCPGSTRPIRSRCYSSPT